MTQLTNPPLARYPELWEALNSDGLKDCRKLSGRFLYSDPSTLRSGKFYLLGHHPGGTLSKHSNLGDDIQTWGTNGTNAYLDETWEHSPTAGSFIVQLNVKALCKAIDVCPRQVCASNLYFVSDYVKVKSLGIVWPIHEIVLDMVKPDIIIALGVDTAPTYKEIKHFLDFSDIKSRCLDNKIGNSFVRVVEGLYKNGKRKLKLIGLPYPDQFHSLKEQKNANALQEIAKECSITEDDYCKNRIFRHCVT
jgi:hypothetical protein